VALLSINPTPVVSELPAGDPPSISRQHGVTLRLDRFAWEAIEEEADRVGVPIEDLIVFSTLYYLADLDSGRIARRISLSSGFGTSQSPPRGPQKTTLA
jgi:hypothetical protein